MIDQNQNPNIIPQPIVPVPTIPVETPVPKWKTLLLKFYSNKKVFWPVSVSFGIIFLIIILGLLFGKRGTTQNVSKLPTPTPVATSTPEASASSDILTTSQIKLNNLKNQINNLDIKESRLKPPVLNFDIKF